MAQTKRGRHAPATEKARSSRSLLRDLPRNERVPVEGGARLRLLVLACTPDDTTAVDLSSGALVRLRVPWPEDHPPDLAAFDVVETVLADDPERNDLAQPEAATAAALPRQVGTLRGRRVRRMLQRLAAPPTARCSASPGRPPPTGSSAAPAPRPPWSPPPGGPSSSAGRPTARPGSASAGSATTSGCRWRTPTPVAPWTRHAGSGWPARPWPPRSASPPHYLLATLSLPREGHCYKVCTAVLPRGAEPRASDSAAELARGQVLGHGPAEGHQPVAGVGRRHRRRARSPRSCTWGLGVDEVEAARHRAVALQHEGRGRRAGRRPRSAWPAGGPRPAPRRWPCGRARAPRRSARRRPGTRRP